MTSEEQEIQGIIESLDVQNHNLRTENSMLKSCVEEQAGEIKRLSKENAELNTRLLHFANSFDGFRP